MKKDASHRAGVVKLFHRVAVNFNGAQYTLSHEAAVINIPSATGDSWVFKDIETQKIHYVSWGGAITSLLPKHEAVEGSWCSPPAHKHIEKADSKRHKI